MTPDLDVLRGPFGRLLAALSITFVGDGIYLVALAWLALDIGDAGTLALAGGAWSVGILLALPLGGALADTTDRRRLLISVDLLRAGALGTIGLLAVTSSLSPLTLAALSVAHGFGDGVAEPAVSGLTPRLVPADRLVRANGWMEAVKPFSMRLLGPGIGALLIAVADAGTAMLIDAATFLFCAVIVATIPPQPGAQQRRGPGLRAEIVDGWRYVTRARWLWPILVGSTGALLATWGALEVLVAVRVKEDLDLGPGAFAAFLTGFGAGQVVGGLAAGARRPVHDLRGTLTAWSAAAASLALYALATAWYHFVAIGAVTGVLISLGAVWWWAGVQQRVPDSHIGRVSSIDHTLTLAFTPLSLALVPLLADLIGNREAFVACGAFAALCFAAPLARGEIRAGRPPQAPGENSRRAPEGTRRPA